MDSKTLNSFIKKHNSVLGITGNYARMPVAEKIKNIDKALRRKGPALVPIREEYKGLKSQQKSKDTAKKEKQKAKVKPKKPTKASFVPVKGSPENINPGGFTGADYIEKEKAEKSAIAKKEYEKEKKKKEKAEKEKAGGGTKKPRPKPELKGKAPILYIPRRLGDPRLQPQFRPELNTIDLNETWRSGLMLGKLPKGLIVKPGESTIGKVKDKLAPYKVDGERGVSLQTQRNNALSNVFNLVLDQAVLEGEIKVMERKMEEDTRREREERRERARLEAEAKAKYERELRDRRRRQGLDPSTGRPLTADQKRGFDPRTMFKAINQYSGLEEWIDKETGMKVGPRVKPFYEKYSKTERKKTSGIVLKDGKYIDSEDGSEIRLF